MASAAGDPASAGPLANPAGLTPVVVHRDDTRLLGVDAFAGHRVVHFRRDGLTGLRISGTDGGEREISLLVNGKVDASSGMDMATQILLGHLPMLLHPEPRAVLVIGSAPSGADERRRPGERTRAASRCRRRRGLPAR